MKSRKPLVIGMIVGALLGTAPVFGLLATVFGMRRVFDTLGQSGIADPAKLSGSIGSTLLGTAVGVFFFFVGAALFITCAIIFMRNRPPDDPTDPPMPS